MKSNPSQRTTNWGKRHVRPPGHRRRWREWCWTRPIRWLRWSQCRPARRKSRIDIGGAEAFSKLKRDITQKAMSQKGMESNISSEKKEVLEDRIRKRRCLVCWDNMMKRPFSISRGSPRLTRLSISTVHEREMMCIGKGYLRPRVRPPQPRGILRSISTLSCDRRAEASRYEMCYFETLVYVDINRLPNYRNCNGY